MVVSRKGQVTIPKKVRDYLGIAPGMSVAFGLREDGEVVVRKIGGEPRRKASLLTHLRGLATAGMSTGEITALTRGRA